MDIVVIGSGIAGLSAAYEASKQGARVAVIDRGPIGRGLTARTSAHLTSALDDFYHEFFPIRGEEIGKLHFASQAAAINRIDEIRTAERIACDFKRLPTYLFLAGEVEPKAPDDEREALETVGLEGSRVDLSPEIFHKLSDGPCVIIPEQRQVPSPKVSRWAGASVPAAPPRRSKSRPRTGTGVTVASYAIQKFTPDSTGYSMSMNSSGNSPRNASGSSTPSNSGSPSSASERPADWWCQQGSLPGARDDNAVRSPSEDVLSKTKDTARATAKALTSQAAELASNIGSELTQTADEQKGRGADAMRGFAKAVHGAADDLDEQSPAVARYVRKAAESVESLSDTVRSRNVNDLIVAAKDTARVHPTAFFVGAVAAGFALSRFFKSSARAAHSESTEVERRDADGKGLGAAREPGSLDFGGRS